MLNAHIYGQYILGQPRSHQQADPKGYTKAFMDNINRQWNGPLCKGPVAVEIELRAAGFETYVMPIQWQDSVGLPGDVDNYAKTILDALRGAAYLDDSQVKRLTVSK